MKNSIILSVILLISTSVSYAVTFSKEHESAKKYLSSKKEKSVFEAVWFNPNYLKVTRYDTGTNQNGFAMYLCSVLAEFGLSGKRIDVEIIDVVNVATKGEWIVLGQTTCR